MQHCEKHDINFHNQNINIISVYNLFFISIQPHLLATPCQKVIALVMVWSFLWTWANSFLPMQFNGYLPKKDYLMCFEDLCTKF